MDHFGPGIRLGVCQCIRVPNVGFHDFSGDFAGKFLPDVYTVRSFLRMFEWFLRGMKG